MDKLRDGVVSQIRSCLISTKARCTLRQLEEDYRTLLGERIPYRTFGFSRLDDFIQSESSLTLSRSPDGQLFVDAKASAESRHIKDMVDKQKSASKKKPRFQGHRARPAAPAARKWRPKNLPTVNLSARMCSKPSVASKVVVPPQSGLSEKRMGKEAEPRHREEPKGRNSNLGSGGDLNGHNGDCSPLASTKRRITKLMASIDLDRDSGNSSPTYDLSPTKMAVEFQRTDNAVVDLKNFAQFHKLGDIDVKFTETKSKPSKQPLYHCKIKIGQQHIFSSYPNDFHDKLSAEKHTAQKALDELIPKYKRCKSLLCSSNEDVLQRIPPMLEKQTNALWTTQLETDYIDLYNEQLPSNWLQIIDSSQFVSIEKCLGGYVLKYCTPGDKIKKWDVNLSLFDGTIAINNIEIKENLSAIITCVASINEIWCQTSGTQEYEQFTKMLVNMEEFYKKMKTQLIPKKIHLNNYYVAEHEGYWSRIRVITNSQKVGFFNCLMVDFGDQCNINENDIFLLRNEFATIQQQAFVCRLVGLEDLYEASLHSDHLTSIIGKDVMLEPANYEPTDDDDKIHPVIMYDYETGYSINETLISLLTIESATPVLEKHNITEVHVSNIEKNGDVYVQIQSPGYNSLKNLLANLKIMLNIIKSPIEYLEQITKDNSKDRLYLKNYKDQWLRTKILDWSPYNELVQIYYVDIGKYEIVDIQKETMYPLDKLNDIINQYPEQAVKVRIMMESIPADFVAMAQNLMPIDQKILLKIIDYDNENVPWVEFFKRSNDGGLFCINKSIAMEAEMKKDSANNNEKIVKKRSRLHLFYDGKTVPSGGWLKKPPLPSKDEFFNVKVPFAVNPWNFFVQPLASLDELNKLMINMQEKYKIIQYSPLNIEDIAQGNIYASKHEDGRWYRTSVLKVIHAGSISVFYCDFGYYTSLTVSQLVPLDPEFLELPYQALKAKLLGIKPIHNKWTMDDCDIFKNLVINKPFSSVVFDIEKDELYTSDIVLKLTLIDTSTTTDIKIHQELIDLGIASPC